MKHAVLFCIHFFETHSNSGGNVFHTVLGVHLDESGWTMLDVGGQNQG